MSMQPHPKYTPGSIYMHLRGMLFERGLFENQADEIMSRLIANEGELMATRWNDATEGYPPVFLPILWMKVKRHAVAWIDENLPQHWARPLFAE